MKFDIKKVIKWQQENSRCLFCRGKTFYRVEILVEPPEERFRVTFVCKKHLNRFFSKMRYLLKWEEEFTANLNQVAYKTISLLNYYNKRYSPELHIFEIG